MKYQAQAQELKRLVDGAKSALVLLPNQASVDHLAAGLAIYLSLNQNGKEVAIATESQILVGHTNLFGVGQIENKMPQSSGGNLVITLGGVAEGGTAPALQRLDYNTSGQDLNLVFYVLPGKKFEPTFITPKYQGGFELFVVIGSPDLNSLGAIYNQNQQTFSGAQMVNIDRSSTNGQFGSLNIVDGEASSLSEMVGGILLDGGLSMDQDISTNLLSGIFAATNNLQAQVSADAFMVISESMRRGGQKPGVEIQPAIQPVTEVVTPQPTPVQSQPQLQSQPQPVVQSTTPPASDAIFNQFLAPTPASNPVGGFQGVPALSQIPPISPTPSINNLNQTAGSPAPEKQPVYNPSPEEAVAGEGLTGGEQVVNPEPDWLTPKVFRSGNLG